MKKKETILCHTFIGTVPLVVGKKFLFEAEGQQPRQMCVVRDYPFIYMTRFLMPGYEVIDCMSGFMVPHIENHAHDARPDRIIQAFYEKMQSGWVSPDRIAAVVKDAKPEDVKWSESELSTIPCEVKTKIKQVYGICL
jgi:hypothetical protein